ncbi:ABC transporter ATP-binding protein [Oceaniglobus ichthyenteri]|uniref:ABC transporter ATP-binding protein n=1 Tax=Oceaniglobus ichthyenteri TaxID=2136177 RepID=UPI000D371393|nr:ATP-binding cassette domain-containing protein [Oceaniglobus ichthyenteri]
MDLDVKNISKSYGRVTALNDLSLTIPAGSLTCFLGPSGCGKTTLLRVIAGLETPERGQIMLGDDDLSDTAPSDRNFGVVFQSYSLFPNLTALRNVQYGLECRGWGRTRRRERAEEMLDLVHLRDQANKLPEQMSGGQQQRIAIARALAPEPSLLLLDEPLSALDAKVRAELRSEIRSIQQKFGITTIMVTHDQNEALEMADQIVVLREGQIEQVGAPRDLYTHPETRFVADFIGAINLLNVTSDAQGKAQLGTHSLAMTGKLNGATTLGLRPEAITLSQQPIGAANELSGVVTQTRFMGNLQHIEIQPDCAPEQRLQIEMNGLATTPASGARVVASFPADALMVLR